MSPVMVTSGGDAPRVADAFTAMPLNLDLDRLLAACPFRSAGYTH